jgi:hypothetical protein
MEITVVTDGSRILGLGDLGLNGILSILPSLFNFRNGYSYWKIVVVYCVCWNQPCKNFTCIFLSSGSGLTFRLLSIMEPTIKNSSKILYISVFDKNESRIRKQRNLLPSSWKLSQNVGLKSLFNSKISILNLRLIYSIPTETSTIVSTMMFASSDFPLC